MIKVKNCVIGTTDEYNALVSRLAAGTDSITVGTVFIISTTGVAYIVTTTNGTKALSKITP